MLFEKIFSGNNSSKEMHSNQYAVGSVSRQTFSQRKSIEQGRTRIASYRHSKLGSNLTPRAEYLASKPQEAVDAQRSAIKPAIGSSKQASPQRAFQEPQTRTFNPYS